MSTIRGKLLVLLLTGLAIVLTAGGAAVYWIAESNLMSQLDAGLKARVQSVASLVSYEPVEETYWFDSGDAPESVRESYFEVRRTDGVVRKRSANLGDMELPFRAPPEGEVEFDDVDLPDSIDGRCAWLAFRPEVDDDDMEEVAAPFVEPPVQIAIAAIDRRPTDRALATLLTALIIVGGVVGLTVGVLVTVGIRWGLVPLDRLSRQLGSVNGATLSQRLDDAGAPGELVPIYRELNSMLDRVECTLERERSFADAAAHELRTPLAELRTTAEVAIKWPDSQRAVAALRELLLIGHEMERLVESLLLISRGHAGAKEGECAGAPVASIVNRCLDHARDAIDHKRLRVNVEIGDQHAMTVPPEALEIITRNLIDNAVQYTPSQGSITIMGEPGANGSSAFIVDNGPVVLDRHDLPRLFEPFWQSEVARSDRQHVGLGLSVVHQIAEAIGLRVEAHLAGDHLQMRVRDIA